MERRTAADLKTCLLSGALDKWHGIGGDGEVFPKLLPYFLHPLFNPRPITARLRGIPDEAFRFCQTRLAPQLLRRLSPQALALEFES